MGPIVELDVVVGGASDEYDCKVVRLGHSYGSPTKRRVRKQLRGSVGQSVKLPAITTPSAPPPPALPGSSPRRAPPTSARLSHEKGSGELEQSKAVTALPQLMPLASQSPADAIAPVLGFCQETTQGEGYRWSKQRQLLKKRRPRLPRSLAADAMARHRSASPMMRSISPDSQATDRAAEKAEKDRSYGGRATLSNALCGAVQKAERQPLDRPTPCPNKPQPGTSSPQPPPQPSSTRPRSLKNRFGSALSIDPMQMLTPEEAKTKFRDAIRHELDICQSLQELEAHVSLLRMALMQSFDAHFASKRRGHSFAHNIFHVAVELFNDTQGRESQENFRLILMRLMNQEMRRRASLLEHIVDNGNEMEELIPLLDAGKRTPAALSTSAGQDAPEVPEAGPPAPPPPKLVRSRTMRKMSSEALLRTSSDRATSKGSAGSKRPSLRRSSTLLAAEGAAKSDMLRKAMELCGIQHPRPHLIESAHSAISKQGSHVPLTSEEFLKFVAKYEDLQLEFVKAMFEKADQDGSGSISVKELASVLRSLSQEPNPRILEELLCDVDLDGSGEINLHEFQILYEALQANEGFSKQEQEQLHELFQRFDAEGRGAVATQGLAAALTWLGFGLSQQEVDIVAADVDSNKSGLLEFHEFLVCVRRMIDRETQTMREAIEAFDTDGDGKISASELEHLLTSLGFVSNTEAVKEAADDACVDEELTLHELVEFVRCYRAREGLSNAELESVDEAMERYDTDQSGEISAMDVGRALRWFGYTMPVERQDALVEAVDVDNSGKIGPTEFRKLLRVYMEGCVQHMKTVYSTMLDAAGGAEGLPEEKCQEAFEELELVSSTGKLPTLRDEDKGTKGLVHLEGFVAACLRFKHDMRNEYRKNGGFSEQGMANLKLFFNEYDEDRSGTVSFPELSGLLRKMFPTPAAETRPQLDNILREISRQHSSKLDFQDFVRACGQFIALQAQEKATRLHRAVLSTGFSQAEVRAFREIFLGDNDAKEVDREISLEELSGMVSRFAILTERNKSILISAFRMAQRLRGPERALNLMKSPRSQVSPSVDTLDFPGFLLVMSELVRKNFGNLQGSDRQSGSPTKKRNITVAEA
eukprot:TRINITY_DN15342_c0_g1_i1.p1 TRINITY_DN15342_c0_g1~~TRINITY_DN15342_c0_g1_i1.p1  ORF type:complete len:1101 (+),score=243.47 TRINITY_DN15342_c0_g1_i1:210-3512(+)